MWIFRSATCEVGFLTGIQITYQVESKIHSLGCSHVSDVSVKPLSPGDLDSGRHAHTLVVRLRRTSLTRPPCQSVTTCRHTMQPHHEFTSRGSLFPLGWKNLSFPVQKLHVPSDSGNCSQGFEILYHDELKIIFLVLCISRFN